MESDDGNGNNSPTRDFMHRIKLETVSEEIGGLIYSVRDLESRVQESAMTGAQVREVFAEMYPPAFLFSPKIMAMPSLYASLRDWLNSKGANLTQHSTRRVIMTLAGSLYDESEDREAALEIAGQLVAQGRRSTRTGTSTTAGGGGDSSTVHTVNQPATASSKEDRTAHNIGMRFKEKDSKFSGDIGQSWIEYVAEYQQVSRDYGLSPTQKSSTCTTYFAGMRSVRQNRVKTYLSTLRLSKFVVDGADELSALEKVYKLITKLSPQVPQSHRGEAHKIEFLRNSTVGFSWATEPLSRISTHGLSFQQLYGELEAALHLEREARVAVLRDKASSVMKNGNSSSSTVPGILFEGQGRYLNRHKGVGDRRRSSLRGRQMQQKIRRPFDPLVI
eukprot:IDg18940t1